MWLVIYTVLNVLSAVSGSGDHLKVIIFSVTWFTVYLKICFILGQRCKITIILPWFMVQTPGTDSSNWQEQRFCLQLATATILPPVGNGDDFTSRASATATIFSLIGDDFDIFFTLQTGLYLIVIYLIVICLNIVFLSCLFKDELFYNLLM